MPEQARWVITSAFTEFLEPIQMTVHSCEDKDVRQICRMELGPFDDPTETLDELLQTIDQAVWEGKPVQLPLGSAD